VALMVIHIWDHGGCNCKYPRSNQHRRHLNRCQKFNELRMALPESEDSHEYRSQPQPYHQDHVYRQISSKAKPKQEEILGLRDCLAMASKVHSGCKLLSQFIPFVDSNGAVLDLRDLGQVATYPGILSLTTSNELENIQEHIHDGDDEVGSGNNDKFKSHNFEEPLDIIDKNDEDLRSTDAPTHYTSVDDGLVEDTKHHLNKDNVDDEKEDQHYHGDFDSASAKNDKLISMLTETNLSAKTCVQGDRFLVTNRNAMRMHLEISLLRLYLALGKFIRALDKPPPRWLNDMKLRMTNLILRSCTKGRMLEMKRETKYRSLFSSLRPYYRSLGATKDRYSKETDQNPLDSGFYHGSKNDKNKGFGRRNCGEEELLNDWPSYAMYRCNGEINGEVNLNLVSNDSHFRVTKARNEIDRIRVIKRDENNAYYRINESKEDQVFSGNLYPFQLNIALPVVNGVSFDASKWRLVSPVTNGNSNNAPSNARDSNANHEIDEVYNWKFNNNEDEKYGWKNDYDGWKNDYDCVKGRSINVQCPPLFDNENSDKLHGPNKNLSLSPESISGIVDEQPPASALQMWPIEIQALKALDLMLQIVRGLAKKFLSDNVDDCDPCDESYAQSILLCLEPGALLRMRRFLNTSYDLMRVDPLTRNRTSTKFAKMANSIHATLQKASTQLNQSQALSDQFQSLSVRRMARWYRSFNRVLLDQAYKLTNECSEDVISIYEITAMERIIASCEMKPRNLYKAEQLPGLRVYLKTIINTSFLRVKNLKPGNEVYLRLCSRAKFCRLSYALKMIRLFAERGIGTELVHSPILPRLVILLSFSSPGNKDNDYPFYMARLAIRGDALAILKRSLINLIEKPMSSSPLNKSTKMIGEDQALEHQQILRNIVGWASLAILCAKRENVVCDPLLNDIGTAAYGRLLSQGWSTQSNLHFLQMGDFRLYEHVINVTGQYYQGKEMSKGYRHGNDNSLADVVHENEFVDAMAKLNDTKVRIENNIEELVHAYKTVEGYHKGPDVFSFTPYPTPAPTHKPTPSPTPSPTPKPTPKPTPEPTNYPTPAPTQKGTGKHTRQPTTNIPESSSHARSKVLKENEFEVALPTTQEQILTSASKSASLDYPSTSTTMQSAMPTADPTPIPTKNPTLAPTEKPTPVPTPEPTPLPTRSPKLASIAKKAKERRELLIQQEKEDERTRQMRRRDEKINKWLKQAGAVIPGATNQQGLKTDKPDPWRELESKTSPNSKLWDIPMAVPNMWIRSVRSKGRGTPDGGMENKRPSIFIKKISSLLMPQRFVTHQPGNCKPVIHPVEHRKFEENRGYIRGLLELFKEPRLVNEKAEKARRRALKEISNVNECRYGWVAAELWEAQFFIDHLKSMISDKAAELINYSTTANQLLKRKAKFKQIGSNGHGVSTDINEEFRNIWDNNIEENLNLSTSKAIAMSHGVCYALNVFKIIASHPPISKRLIQEHQDSIIFLILPILESEVSIVSWSLKQNALVLLGMMMSTCTKEDRSWVWKHGIINVLIKHLKTDGLLQSIAISVMRLALNDEIALKHLSSSGHAGVFEFELLAMTMGNCIDSLFIQHIGGPGDPNSDNGCSDMAATDNTWEDDGGEHVNGHNGFSLNSMALMAFRDLLALYVSVLEAIPSEATPIFSRHCPKTFLVPSFFIRFLEVIECSNGTFIHSNNTSSNPLLSATQKYISKLQTLLRLPQLQHKTN